MPWREQATLRWDDDALFLLDQHAKMDLYNASLQETTIRGWTYVGPRGHIILISSQPDLTP